MAEQEELEAMRGILAEYPNISAGELAQYTMEACPPDVREESVDLVYNDLLGHAQDMVDGEGSE